MPFFWSKKVKAHSPTFILFVKLCKKPIKKKKMTLALFLQWGRLSWKTQQWHILYIVLSPLTLYWVLQGDQKQQQQQQKAPAPKIMQTKQRFARALSAPHNRTKPWTSRNRIYPFRQVGGVRWKRWTQRKRGRFPWERGFPSRKEPRNHLTPRPVGPKNAPGAKRDGAQTDKTQGYGKVMCKLEPSLPLSLFIHQ